MGKLEGFLNAERIRSSLQEHPGLSGHSQNWPLTRIASGGSNLSTAGFPYIVEESFRLFVDHVPHLFDDGRSVLEWVDRLEDILRDWSDLSEVETESLARTCNVIRNVVFTANVTAPSDLWLLRQVLGTHCELGLLDILLNRGHLAVPTVCRELGLDGKRLYHDLEFLEARGLLRGGPDGYHVGENAAAHATLASAKPLAPEFRERMAQKSRDWIAGAGQDSAELFETFFDLSDVAVGPRTGIWVPDWDQIELGFRLVPLVLGLRAANLTKPLITDASLSKTVPFLLPGMAATLSRAGLVSEGRVTVLGARVFSRGPGPFGIIAAYDAYMTELADLLRGEEKKSWVARGENVAASQDANRRTFTAANDALDQFCKDTGFRYTIFIEHAVGKGEATRQRFARSGDRSVRYFGADLEDAAIDSAVREQGRGKLPRNMAFIRGADIGVPSRVTDFLKDEGIDPYGAVMMVGNGFHEIRDQTDAKMTAVFQAYREAGILLIFTEETGLSNNDLLQTAWNTYHAGFRYVHEISGQGLRPARTADSREGRWSWARCAAEAGYAVLKAYTTKTRTIYPYCKGRGGNPSISVSYFCVPGDLASKLHQVAATEEELLER